MGRFSLFSSDDRGQSVRFRRYLIAAGTSLMVVALLGVSSVGGVLPRHAFLTAAGFVVTAIAVFYLVFRSGWNKHAHDPSLTVPMMIAAICVVTYAVYHAGPMRSVFLLLYPMIMFFGVFRLGTRALLVVCALILCAYALVLWLLMQPPSRLEASVAEWVRGLVLAAVLVWFAFMGGYVHNLRVQLRQSGFDEVTNVYNRRRLLEILAHEKTRCDRGAGPLCVCIADIDRFKQVNDSLGHRMGDLTLQTFIRVAQRELRAIDFIGRYGGDEFLMVLTQTPLSGARECAERVREQMELADIQGADGPGQITVSIGIAQYRPGESLEETLARADAALYRAKTGGRNGVECE
jgi:diguanylate cyclase (GGDEF)-like protein